MTETLLKYGADPDKCSEIYNYDPEVNQYLLPLYYSLDYAESYEKTAF